MPTARWGSAVVHIPGGGVPVIGGTAMTGDLPNVELLEIMSVGERDVHTWRQVDSMIKALRCPSAVYFDEASILSVLAKVQCRCCLCLIINQDSGP